MISMKLSQCIIKLGFLVFIPGLSGISQAPAGYYDGTQNLEGYPLKAKLNQIVSAKTTSWNYGDLPAYYEQTDKDHYYENDGSVLDMYAENPAGADPYNYWYNNNSLIAGASNEGEGWNREHIYSQSFFNSNYPMYSDLHFIVPTDARVNQRRSNFPFGKVGSPVFTSLNGTRVGPANMPGYTNTVTEPIDAFKGDIARMLMYVAIRYENLIPYFQYTNIRNPIDSLSERAFKSWYISLLLQWHQQDPVSQKEIDRNNAVYAIQGNRNPFVDNPQYAQAIWANLPAGTAVPEQPYQLNAAAVRARHITVSWPYVQDPDVLGFEVFINDIKVGTTGQNEFTFHHLEPATSYNIKVRSYSHSYVKSPFTVLSSVTTLSTDTFSRDLFISRLIVGSGQNKAIELTNNTGYEVDLRDYYINIRQINQSTGSLYWSSNKLQLEGTLQQGRKFVLLNPLAVLSCFSKDSADILSNATQMRLDGKLAIELAYSNTTVDRLGDPSANTDYAAHKSLYRKPAVINPNNSFDTTEWDSYPENYCEGLGNQAEEPPTRISTVNKSNEFYLYPNPNYNKVLHIKGNLDQVKEIKILSLEGSIIQILKGPSNGTIRLPGNSSGLLVISINGKGYPVLVY
ncbi:MAG: endonuclease I [Sphingobacteriales bacterium]|nr:MAG: endonuclease I [Sphingobacteriales bacterium]